MNSRFSLALLLLAAGCAQNTKPSPDIPLRAMGKSVATEVSPSDETIGPEIRRRFVTAGPGDTAGIVIEVSDGIVTLRGVAPTQAAAWRAESAALSVAGVKQVRNQITVNTPSVLP